MVKCQDLVGSLRVVKISFLSKRIFAKSAILLELFRDLVTDDSIVQLLAYGILSGISMPYLFLLVQLDGLLLMELFNASCLSSPALLVGRNGIFFLSVTSLGGLPSEYWSQCVVFEGQLYLYHFVVLRFLIYYLRILWFSGHHIVAFSVMSNCNCNVSLGNMLLTSGTDQLETINNNTNTRLDVDPAVEYSERKDKQLPNSRDTVGIVVHL